MKDDIRVICKYLSWAVRKAPVYASYNVVEEDDLWSAKLVLLETLPSLELNDKRRLMNYYISLLKSRNILEEGLSF